MTDVRSVVLTTEQIEAVLQACRGMEAERIDALVSAQAVLTEALSPPMLTLSNPDVDPRNANWLRHLGDKDERGK